MSLPDTKKSVGVSKTNIAKELYTTIARLTPIDSGQATINWNISVGEADKTVVLLDKNKKLTKEQAMGPVNQKADSIPDNASGNIVISNNLPYIEKLENGSSLQAPSGMIGTSLEYIKAKYNGK